MFEIPRAKRVRREELHGSDSSRQGSPDESIVDTFRAAQLDYEIVQPVIESSVRPETQVEGEEEAEFNLFAKPTTGAASQPVKISLRSPSPDAEGRFVVPTRSDDYYFTGVMPEGLVEQYRLSALSGQDVQRLATAYRPGSTFPWKVTTFPAGGAVKATKVTDNSRPEDDNVTRKKRARPGKLGRIKKRKAQAAELSLKEVEKAAKEDKDRAEREKRARRNREKKFKKRARDKAKKQGGGSTGEAMTGGDGGDSSSDETQAA